MKKQSFWVGGCRFFVSDVVSGDRPPWSTSLSPGPKPFRW